VVHGLHRKGGGEWVVVACEKENGKCELRSSIRHDELGDM
jgi:hypothetical protein